MLDVKTGNVLSMDIYNTEYTLAKGISNGVPQENIDKEKQVTTKQRKSFTTAVEAGDKMVLGKDAGIYSHDDNAKQLVEYLNLAMTELQAIQAATINSTQLFKWQNKVGQLKTGIILIVLRLTTTLSRILAP